MSPPAIHPLFLAPIYRRYIWGGRRFTTALGRDLPPGDDYAESWELVDRGADQSVVSAGPLAGTALGTLVRERGTELLGRHAPRPAFPLLFKFLDACHDLSVQVHPDDSRAARLSPPDFGKTEAWYVVDAAPGSRIYAGLLVAEIQQSSDVTYRLHDWGRVGADGRPRPLHIEAGLESVTRFGPVAPVRPEATTDPSVRRLVDCPYFSFDEVRPDGTWETGGDGTCSFLAVIAGTVRFDDRWQLPALGRGGCVLLPAACGRQRIAVTADATGTPPTLLRVGLGRVESA